MLLASATSPFQRRASPYVIALAADPAAGVIVCGDSQGDVFAFALPPALAAAPGAAAARSLGQRQRRVLTHSRKCCSNTVRCCVRCRCRFLLYVLQASMKALRVVHTSSSWQQLKVRVLRRTESSSPIYAGGVTADPTGAGPLQLQCVAAFPRIHGRAPVGFCAIHSGGHPTAGTSANTHLSHVPGVFPCSLRGMIAS